MGTAERRIEIMRVLCRERHATMPFLAEMFSVSIRTIKRDIDELSCIIPLEIRGGRYCGGVYVMRDYSWDRVYMSDDDISLLLTIIAIGQTGGRLLLDEISLNRLRNMISVYSRPRIK